MSGPSETAALLVVNADDWGESDATTDKIVDCFSRGGISSATAMMHMQGSARAADIALERDLPIGLHLNLTVPFTDPEAPRALNERQARVAARLRNFRAQRWLYDPRVQHDVEFSIQDQLSTFRHLYGRDPTHFDGHHHVHVALNVLFARALPSGVKLRRSESLSRERRSPLLGFMRDLRHRVAYRRFTTTDRFVSIRSLTPELGGRLTLEAILCDDIRSIEVMGHPGFRDEYDALTSDQWLRAVSGGKMTSFAAVPLQGRPYGHRG